MPSLLLHVAAIERLAADPTGLPKGFERGLREDLPYARFGAALPDLPQTARLGGAGRLVAPAEKSPFTDALHEKAPLGFGLKLAELVASGALVGGGAGRAVLAGYLVHVRLDEVLVPRELALAERYRHAGESVEHARARLEWAQALFFLREIHGVDLAGHPLMREKLTLLKHSGYPLRGVGGGLYELVRLSALETLGVRVEKRELDAWVRRAYLTGAWLASRLGRARGIGRLPDELFQEVFRGPGIDLPAQVFAAIDSARELIRRVDEYMAKGRFTPKARGRVLGEFPELMPHRGG